MNNNKLEYIKGVFLLKDDVMTNEALSELYESEINIVEVKEFNRKICIASDW